MSNIRIKDLSTEATSLGTDDFIPVDGNTSGTRKISKENLGATLEIPNVGTAPNETPLNQHLGSLAYQSSDGVSMVNAEVETLEVTDKVTGPLTVSNTSAATSFILANSGGGTTLNFAVTENTGGIIDASEGASARNILFKTGGTERVRIDSSGRVGIGTSSPDRPLHSYASSVATALKLDSAGIDTGVEFAHSGTVAAAINCSTGGNLEFRTGANSGANERWRIDGSNGNLVANGTAIDFGSGATLDEYEVGTWTPAYTTTSSGFTNPPTMDVVSARYVRIGDLVTFFADIRTDSVDLTGAGTYLLLGGLPYAATVASGGNNVAVNVSYAQLWANAPAAGYVQGGQSYIYLTKRSTSITGRLAEMSPSDLTAGTNANHNALIISGSYYTNA